MSIKQQELAITLLHTYRNTDLPYQGEEMVIYGTKIIVFGLSFVIDNSYKVNLIRGHIA